MRLWMCLLCCLVLLHLKKHIASTDWIKLKMSWQLSSQFPSQTIGCKNFLAKWYVNHWFNNINWAFYRFSWNFLCAFFSEFFKLLVVSLHCWFGIFFCKLHMLNGETCQLHMTRSHGFVMFLVLHIWCLLLQCFAYHALLSSHAVHNLLLLLDSSPFTGQIAPNYNMWLKCILAANLLVNWLIAQKLCRLCSDYNTTLQLNISLCSFHCFLVCIWLIVEYSLCLFQLYRLEKYSECYVIYKDLLKNTQVCNVYSCVNAFNSSAGSCVDLCGVWHCLGESVMM